MGCSDAMSSGQFNEAEAPGGSGEDKKTEFGGTDASPIPQSLRGSPLCGVRADNCNPDDDGRPVADADAGTSAPPPSNSMTCPDPAPDAGVATGDGGTTAASACRVVKQTSGYSPTECQAADRRGTDGVSCQSGAECAPGFDCVDSDKGGVCRRYCCSGSCADQSSQNGGATFCDVQKVLDPNTDKAPVCMPLKKCTLLKPGGCIDNETCAVVTEKGDTGCVVTGTVLVGQSCDVDHCAIGLTCLGNPGDRRCYKLCRIDGNQCDAPEKCMTGAVFQDTSFGVCRELNNSR